jgi:hypothetical protein
VQPLADWKNPFEHEQVPLALTGEPPRQERQVLELLQEAQLELQAKQLVPERKKPAAQTHWPPTRVWLALQVRHWEARDPLHVRQLELQAKQEPVNVLR